MNQRNFTEAELSQDEKDEIGLLVSKKILDPTVWTMENFPDDSLLRVCKRALKEQQGAGGGWISAFFEGLRSLFVSEPTRDSIEQLRTEVLSLNHQLQVQAEDMHCWIAPRFTTKLKLSSVLFINDDGESIGVGIFVTPSRVVSAFHVVKYHFKSISRANYISVKVRGRYHRTDAAHDLTDSFFSVAFHDTKLDLVVFDIVGDNDHHTWCSLPEVHSMEGMPLTTRFVVTSFTSAMAKQAPDKIDESFACIPAELLKLTVNHCAYSSTLFSGDSGGAVLLSSDGSLLCIHLETVNEACEKLQKKVNNSEVVESINSLVNGLSSGFIGLRLDSQKVRDLILNAKHQS